MSRSGQKRTCYLRAEVVQVADFSLIHLPKNIEQYQEGVGLVYKELRICNYCQSTPDAQVKT